MNKSLIALTIAMGLAVSITNARADVNSELASFQQQWDNGDSSSRAAAFQRALSLQDRTTDGKEWTVINDWLAYHQLTSAPAQLSTGETVVNGVIVSGSTTTKPTTTTQQVSSGSYDDTKVKDDIAQLKRVQTGQAQNIHRGLAVMFGNNGSSDAMDKDQSWMGDKGLVDLVKENKEAIANTSADNLTVGIDGNGNGDSRSKRPLRDVLISHQGAINNLQSTKADKSDVEEAKNNALDAFNNSLEAESRSTANEKNISTLGDAVNQHATEITKLQDASKASLEVVKEHATAIDNNTNKLINHDKRITKNEQRIEANEQWQAQAESTVNELIDAHNEVVEEVSHYSSAIDNNSQRIGAVEKHQADQDKTIAANHKKAMAGVSSALALTGLHYTDTTSSAAIGVGNYGGQSAVAVGFSRQFGGNRVRLSIQNSIDTTHNIGTAASLAVGW